MNRAPYHVAASTRYHGDGGCSRPHSHMTLSESLEQGSREAALAVASAPLVVRGHTLVERPWGGVRLREHKGLLPLPDQKAITGVGIGESFEICADPDDEECSRRPSVVQLPDGSSAHLMDVLRAAGDAVLGRGVHQRVGARFPLLPKLLDVGELLSVQAHPEGNTEAYVILDAAPGATLHLGFGQATTADQLRRLVARGQGVVSELERLHRDQVPGAGASTDELLGALAEVNAAVMGTLNVLPVSAGMVVHNATPLRVVERTGRRRSAEVHALGNADARPILALEIRKPGVTHRLWDHGRLPVRPLHVEEALAALSLEPTSPEEFVVERVDTADPRLRRSIIDPAFVVEHLSLAADESFATAPSGLHTLHVTRGAIRIRLEGGREVRVACGASALGPDAMGEHEIHATSDAEVVRVLVR